MIFNKLFIATAVARGIRARFDVITIIIIHRFGLIIQVSVGSSRPLIQFSIRFRVGRVIPIIGVFF